MGIAEKAAFGYVFEIAKVLFGFACKCKESEKCVFIGVRL